VSASPEPHVSIVVIAYNEEARIERCVQALLAQVTDVAYEVVVVDDASSDETAAVVTRIAESSPRVRLVRHEVNRGRGAARRTGQDSSNSPYIGFVDADIEVGADWLDSLLAALRDCDAVSGVASPDGDCAVLWRIFSAELKFQPGSAEFTGNNVIFRADVLREIPFDPNARLGEDFRLAKKMVAAGKRVRTLESVVVIHHEAKSYRKAVSWMWQSGRDSTQLLREFRIVRMPDLAWLTWLVLSVAAIVAALVGALSPLVAVAVVFGAAVGVNVLYIYSRFSVAKPLRWLATAVANIPLMVNYLLGRTWGLLALLWTGNQKSEL
jgi:glycosyltransferase involved in cell wall biosynthesis